MRATFVICRFLSEAKRVSKASGGRGDLSIHCIHACILIFSRRQHFEDAINVTRRQEGSDDWILRILKNSAKRQRSQGNNELLCHSFHSFTLSWDVLNEKQSQGRNRKEEDMENRSVCHYQQLPLEQKEQPTASLFSSRHKRHTNTGCDKFSLENSAPS